MPPCTSDNVNGISPGTANAVNNSGQVVGAYFNYAANDFHAYMWKVGDSSLTDLNDLLPANSGWVLESVVGINSSGQIVGEGRLNGQSHAYFLNTPTPSSYQLSVAPASQTATIGGGQGLVKATLLDGATSAPASNVKLSFRVEAGPNAGLSGTCFPSSCTTDANGQVDWGYLGKAIGVDTVQVWMDTNGNGVPDTGEPQTTATVTWIPLQAQAYVALGDSYSSGEGAPNPHFLPGTDDHTIPNLCHRSTAAYPWLTHQATRNTYPTFVFRACSGAKIIDFFLPNQEKNKGESAQLSWLNSYTGLVTLTIGGNDVGFHDVMEYCAVRLPFFHSTSCEAKFSAQVDAAIARIGAAGSQKNSYTLPYLYKTIKSKAQNAKVLVLGYPRLFPINPPQKCATGVPGSTFRQSDMMWLNKEGSKLDNAIKKAALQAGFTYIDIYNAFNGHELCTKDPYLNRAILDATSPPPFKKLVAWSFHPNVAGQQALAAYVAAFLKSWSTV